jgi:hypothetical protein
LLLLLLFGARRYSTAASASGLLFELGQAGGSDLWMDVRDVEKGGVSVILPLQDLRRPFWLVFVKSRKGGVQVNMKALQTYNVDFGGG